MSKSYRPRLEVHQENQSEWPSLISKWLDELDEEGAVFGFGPDSGSHREKTFQKKMAIQTTEISTQS